MHDPGVPRSAATFRDQAVKRLRRLNRGLVAGSALLVALFSEVAAHALPGRSVAVRSAAPTSSSGSAATRGGTAGADPSRVGSSTAGGSTSGSGSADSSRSGAHTIRPSRARSSTPGASGDGAGASTPSLAPPAEPPVVTQAPAQTSSGGS